MASSSRIDYEIISDPLNPRCVVACFNYSIFGEVTEEDKLLLERIRGKEDDTSPKYTDQEERNLINKQIRKSQGFDVDFSKFRCLFDFYPSFLDECHSTVITETDRQFFGRLAQESVADYKFTTLERLKPTEEEIVSIELQPHSPMQWEDSEEIAVVFARAGPELFYN
ncbi:hypothetical protein F2Q69_00001110 [Brassica cretica]|uniref:Uncharacterized protein n=1 Tax=Brassica cretica TaxID=69181 RepID=A0A8S9P9L7_BRACR|nr:hypothetical protein F2Q69_00001110 [Brassica cretica]